MSLAHALSLLAPPLCWSCGAPAPEHDPLCRDCRRSLRWLGSRPFVLDGLITWAPIAYEGPARALVRALKFRGAVGVADAMAAQIAANAQPALLRDATLVPMPLHRARARRRGFNQAERIASALAARRDLELADCLVREGSRATQVGRDRAERITGIEGAIAVRRGAALPRTPIVLVDDVTTTGATLAACARVLRGRGASVHAAIAYARTPAR